MNLKKAQSKQPIPEHAKKVFTGVIFDVYQWDQELYDGSIVKFEKLKRADSVNIFPITSDKKIVLTRQEQPGIKPFIGSVGGVVEENEDILAAAYREMVEESGYECNLFDLWFSVQPSSKTESTVFSFFARDAVKKYNLNLDAGEKIEVFEVDFDEFVQICADPKFRDTEVALRVLRIARDKTKLDELKSLFLGD